MGETPAAEKLDHADAIVILGGDPVRATTAALLYKQGLASRLIISSDSTRMLETLEVCGVPPSVVEVEDIAKSTADHPRTIQALPGITPESRLILITSKYHPMRVRMVFENAGYKNFQVYSRDSQWWALLRDQATMGPKRGIDLMYELLAYGKDWFQTRPNK